MHIAIVNLTRGTLSGGYRKYLQHVVPLVRQHPAVRRVDVYLPSQMVAEGDEAQTWPPSDAWRGYRRLREQVLAQKPDVVFIPSARWVPFDGIPVVTMIQNMEPLETPFGGNTVVEGMKNLGRAAVARHACRRADRVIAVSQYVREFLERRWAIDHDKIGVVYLGIDAPASREMVRPAALDRLGDAPFLFTAGSLRPARGLEDLVHALALDRHSGWKAVIAGKTDPGTHGYRGRLDALAAERDVSDRILYTGQLSPAEMSWCFRHAQAFVMTSRVEACPNIALEAMVHGCVTVSTDNPPMPEVFRDAARYYDARDGASLAAAIRCTLSLSDSEKASIRARAIERAGDFQWRDTAEQTVRQITLALETH